MQRISIFRTVMGATLSLGAVMSHAADFNFSGDLFNNTDRVVVSFDLASASNVNLWTDSWHGGTNFDPVAALWVQAGNDYTLVQEVDDNDTVAVGQGAYDSGMSFSGLAAGHYLYTLGASFVTPFAAGTLLSQGFTTDGVAPTPIAQWNQPSYDLNVNDQKGTAYSIHLAGVNSASVSAVPEPTSVALLLAGLGLVGQIARRKSRTRA